MPAADAGGLRVLVEQGRADGEVGAGDVVVFAAAGDRAGWFASAGDAAAEAAWIAAVDAAVAVVVDAVAALRGARDHEVVKDQRLALAHRGVAADKTWLGVDRLADGLSAA